MRRKVIKQGNNSYTVTLPVNWIREGGLDKGGEIDLDEGDGKVIISNPGAVVNKEKSVKFNLEDYNERTIRNVLNQAYRKGYNKIVLEVSSQDQLKSVKKVTNETLLGFEITEEESSLIVLENIAEPSNKKFEVILRKLFFIIQDESKEILEALKNKKKVNLKEGIENKNLMDNYTNFLRRIIIKNKIGGTKDSYLNYYFVSQLSLIQHSYYYLSVALEKKNVSLDIIDLMHEANNLFELLNEGFYKKDIHKAHKISENRDKLQKTLFKLMKKNKGNFSEVFYNLGELIRHIHLASTVLFGILPENKI